MILVDDRQGSKDLVKHPPLDNPSVAELARLDSGDVCFVGHGPCGESVVGVELKSVSDLLSSRQNGRLQGVDGQIPEMLTGYDERWIVTYGTYRCGDTGDLEYMRREKVRGKLSAVWHPYTFGGVRAGKPVRYAFLESTLISLSDVGIRHHHVYDVAQAARWIHVLYLKRQKSWADQCKMFRSWNQSREMTEGAYRRAEAGLDCDSGIAAMPTPIDPVEFAIAKFAATFDGVEYKRAVNASRHFNSVYEAATAPASQWERVSKIGKVLSKSIYETIRRTKQ